MRERHLTRISLFPSRCLRSSTRQMTMQQQHGFFCAPLFSVGESLPEFSAASFISFVCGRPDRTLTKPSISLTERIQSVLRAYFFLRCGEISAEGKVSELQALHFFTVVQQLHTT